MIYVSRVPSAHTIRRMVNPLQEQELAGARRPRGVFDDTKDSGTWKTSLFDCGFVL